MRKTNHDDLPDPARERIETEGEFFNRKVPCGGCGASPGDWMVMRLDDAYPFSHWRPP